MAGKIAPDEVASTAERAISDWFKKSQDRSLEQIDFHCKFEDLNVGPAELEDLSNFVMQQVEEKVGSIGIKRQLHLHGTPADIVKKVAAAVVALPGEPTTPPSGPFITELPGEPLTGEPVTQASESFSDKK